MKVFYVWTSLLSFCALMTFCQEHSPWKQNEIGDIAKAKTEDFKVRLHQKLEELRVLRDLLIQGKSTLLPTVKHIPIKIKNPYNLSEGCVVQGEDFPAVFVVTLHNSLLLLKNLSFISVKGFPPNRPFYSLQALTHRHHILLIALHINKRGLHFMKLYKFHSNTFESGLKIGLRGPSILSVTKVGHVAYAAVASTGDLFNELKLYQWTGMLLDEILTERSDKKVSALIIWGMEENLYLAQSYTGLKRVEVKRFRKHSGAMHTIQILEVEARIIKYFDDVLNNHLICGTSDSIVIYWWSGSSFLQEQDIVFDKTIKDVAIEMLSEKVIITVVFYDEVRFLVQDSSAKYVVAGNINFSPLTTLKHVLLRKRGKLLHLLPMFGEDPSPHVYEISLEYHETSDHKFHPPLVECIESVHRHVRESQDKIKEISSILKNVISPSVDFNARSLKVTGSIKSLKKIDINQLHLETNVPSPSRLKEKTEEVVKSAKRMQRDMTKLVTKSQNQVLRGALVFKNFTVNNATIDVIKNNITINKINSSSLSTVLRKSGNQDFRNPVIISQVFCQEATALTLNENKIEDYVLLISGYLNMSGHFRFGSLTTKSVKTNGKINEMNVSHFILTSKMQDIHDMKVFTNLSAKSINTNKRFGGIHLDENKIVYLNSTEFPPVKFLSDIVIKKNLSISLANNYNISHLFSRAVNKSSEQYINGDKTFKSMIVRGNMNVNLRINNCTLNQFMNTNTTQNIHGDVIFSNITTFLNIDTDSLNGIDLSSQAVVKSMDNQVKGVKTFRESLNVSEISMKKGVLIDGFDPSLEVPNIYMKNMDGVQEYWFSDATIKNAIVTNLEVKEDYFPCLRDYSNVWLRNTKQNISHLEIKNMKIGKLQVSRINGLSIEDFVTVHDDETIVGPKWFTGHLVTKKLTLKKGANFNFSPEIWNPHAKVKIINNVTILNAAIESDLKVDGSLKNFENGFMHAKNEQIVKGAIEFDFISTKELISKNISIELLNEINISDFMDNATVLLGNKVIHDKHFKMINASNMVCGGKLSDTFIDRIVTLNSRQKINSSWKFLNTSLFKKINTTKFFEEIRLDDIVYTDELQKVSNKLFAGNTLTSYLNASGKISEVNITELQLKSFNKSEEITLEEKIVFTENLTAQELNIVGSKIDGVDFNDLIRLNDVSTFKSLHASDVTAENISLVGRINECDWMPIIENVLKVNPQNISQSVNIKDLVVEGNLKLSYLNGDKISDWISLMQLSSSPEFEGIFEFERLKMNHLTLLDSVNNISMDFLMNDTMKKTIPQVITGKKTFQEMGVKNTVIEQIISNTTCGINTSEIFEYYVSKKNEHPILLEALAIGGLFSNQLNITGKLNTLQLPEDAILSNDNEVIEAEVTINNTVNASAGISVYKIDGISLESFLKERITLKYAQEIFSALNFTEDVHLKGNTMVNGTINSIRLKEVINSVQNQTIHGAKNFTSGLNFASNVTVHGRINGLSLENILWSTRNESLKNVTFSAINTTSLVCNSINGLNVIDFYNYTHNVVHYLNEKLDDFTADILSFDEMIRKQKDVAEHPLSLFNYFDLFKIIDFASIKKFLPVYEYGVLGEDYEIQTTQMVMWVENSHACMKTRSLIANISQDGSLDIDKKMRGKIFPFSLRVDKDDVVGFYVQAEHSRRCVPGAKSTIVIKTIYSFGDMEKTSIASLADATLFDVKLLELDEIFMMFAYNVKGSSSRILVYQYEAMNNTWSLIQTFHESNITSLDVISVEWDSSSFFDHPSVYLSVTGNESSPGIMIYEWDFDTSEFFLKTNLSTPVSSNARWVYSDDELYLLLAREKTLVKKERMTMNVFTQPVEVYTLDEEELVLSHVVNVKGVHALEAFVLAEEAFVLASSNHMGAVYILQLRGYNGFEVVQEIPAPGVTEARVYTVDSNLYLALSSQTVPSKILKASIRGGRLSLN